MDAITTIHKLEQMVTAAVRAETKGKLTATQCRLLLIIGAVDQPSQTDLVGLTGIDRSTMASALRLMETAGLVTRTRGKEDRRELLLKLTATGRAKAEVARKVWNAVEAQIAARVKGLDKLRIVEEPAVWKPAEQRAAA